MAVTLSHGDAFEYVAKTLDAKLKEAGISRGKADEIIAAAAVASIDGWRDVAWKGYLRPMTADQDNLARSVLKSSYNFV